MWIIMQFYIVSMEDMVNPESSTHCKKTHANTEMFLGPGIRRKKMRGGRLLFYFLRIKSTSLVHQIMLEPLTALPECTLHQFIYTRLFVEAAIWANDSSLIYSRHFGFILFFLMAGPNTLTWKKNVNFCIWLLCSLYLQHLLFFLVCFIKLVKMFSSSVLACVFLNCCV